MKKLFSILVTVALLAGMMLPMAVSAADLNSDTPTTAITADGISKISFATTFADDIQVNEPSGTDITSSSAIRNCVNGTSNDATTSETAPEGGHFIWVTRSNTAKGSYALLTAPVEVAQAGLYNVTVYSSAGTTQLIVGDKTYDPTRVELITSRYYASTTNQWSGDVQCSVNYYTIPLTTSINAVTMKFTASIFNATGTFNWCFDAAYFENAARKINTNAVTRFEFEDYNSADYITTSEGGLRQNVGSLGGTVVSVRNGINSASALKIHGFPNTYPYGQTPNALGVGKETTRINAAGTAFESYTLIEEDGNNFNAMLNAGYVAITVPIVVQAAGSYQFDIVCHNSYNGAGCGSPVDIYRGSDITVDSNKLNRISARELQSPGVSSFNFASLRDYMNYTEAHIDSWLGDAGQMARYVFNADLTTADTSLTFVVRPYFLNTDTPTGSNAPRLYQYLDSFSITPAGLTSSLNADGTGSIRVTERTFGGKATLALYNGNKLVSIQKWDDMTGEAVFEATEAFDGTITSAKFFIWGDYDNCVPKISVIDVPIVAAN